MSKAIQIVTCFVLVLGFGNAHGIERGDPVRGQEIAESQCLSCHSADAVDGNDEWPRISGQHSEYLVQALRDYKNGRRNNAIMRGQVENLSLQDMRDLAAWFSRQDGDLYTPGRP